MVPHQIQNPNKKKKKGNSIVEKYHKLELAEESISKFEDRSMKMV